MSERKVIVIGSGLGGLTSALLLAQRGFDVTVLEQSAQPGGCLQCFRRGEAKFETGMHFIGSAAEGQTLDRLLGMLGVRQDIRLQQLDTQGYDVVALEGELFPFANGREAFISTLARRFPHQQRQLEQYFDLIKEVSADSSLRSIGSTSPTIMPGAKYQLLSIDQVVESVITDPLLQRVLVGNLPLYAGELGHTPFATHAFITDFYNQSAFRVVGGSDAIARSLVGSIRSLGGRVVTNCRVESIVTDSEKATGVTIQGGDFLPADIIISDTHPMRTLELTRSNLIRPAFRNRINAMRQTVGCFALYLDFKPQTVAYMNHNFYGYTGHTPWDCEKYLPSDWPRGFLYMHFASELQQQWAKTGVVLTYMRWDDVAQWSNTTVGRRGQAYEDFKQQKAGVLMEAVEKFFPGLGSHVSRCYTSTPLTYRDYTGTEGGSMYGVARDAIHPEACRVSHRLRIPNVYQTGQNINSHGILGTIIGSLITCGELR
ncbi:MAG: NAD(P)/FAD-dependent oxidoreductase [Prevotella sp.]|nr:NAD(P)/FAD-dependent oxidoreductase [Prevotella sp.]